MMVAMAARAIGCDGLQATAHLRDQSGQAAGQQSTEFTNGVSPWHLLALDAIGVTPIAADLLIYGSTYLALSIDKTVSCELKTQT